MLQLKLGHILKYKTQNWEANKNTKKALQDLRMALEIGTRLSKSSKQKQNKQMYFYKSEIAHNSKVTHSSN